MLHDLHIDEKRTLLLLNKMDSPGADSYSQAALARYPNAIPISAKSGEGIERLSAAVSNSLSEGFVTISVRLEVSDGRTMAWLAKVGEILSKQFHDEYVEIHARLPARHGGRLRHDGFVVDVLNGRLPDEKPKCENWEQQLPTVGSLFPPVAPSTMPLGDEDH